MSQTTRAQRHSSGSPRAGFTLIEVLIALSLVTGTLVVMIMLTASSIRETQVASMRGVVVDLIRGKMYDIEAQLLEDGFQELDQSEEGDFSDEGWPDIKWEAKVEKVELPGLNTLGAVGAEGEAEGEDGQGGIAASPLGSMLGGFGVDPGQTGDVGFIASQFELISKVLEASIRKVTVTVTWDVGNEDDKMVVACYFTDPKSMNKVISTGGIDESDGGGDSDDRGGSSGVGGDRGGSDGRGGSGGLPGGDRGGRTGGRR